MEGQIRHGVAGLRPAARRLREDAGLGRIGGYGGENARLLLGRIAGVPCAHRRRWAVGQSAAGLRAVLGAVHGRRAGRYPAGAVRRSCPTPPPPPRICSPATGCWRLAARRSRISASCRRSSRSIRTRCWISPSNAVSPWLPQPVQLGSVSADGETAGRLGVVGKLSALHRYSPPAAIAAGAQETVSRNSPAGSACSGSWLCTIRV